MRLALITATLIVGVCSVGLASDIIYPESGTVVLLGIKINVLFRMVIKF
jgi:hypothetical protein